MPTLPENEQLMPENEPENILKIQLREKLSPQSIFSVLSLFSVNSVSRLLPSENPARSCPAHVNIFFQLKPGRIHPNLCNCNQIEPGHNPDTTRTRPDKPGRNRDKAASARTIAGQIRTNPDAPPYSLAPISLSACAPLA